MLHIRRIYNNKDEINLMDKFDGRRMETPVFFQYTNTMNNDISRVGTRLILI